MFKIKTYNTISTAGLAHFPPDLYEVGPMVSKPDAILCRSHQVSVADVEPSVQAIARAGAGVNTIPVAELTPRGVVIFNTPGANANAVKEMVISAMLLSSRNLVQGLDFIRQLQGEDQRLHAQVEQSKKHFIGFELTGRTLGVVGLGAVGVKVANAAISLGMKVLGYDPMITVQRAWELSANVVQAQSVEELLKQSDVVTLHVPLAQSTENLINASRLTMMKEGAMLINFARRGIVEEEAVKAVLNHKKLHSYITDFPSAVLMGQPRVIAFPHLGASTVEAQENCALMAVKQLRMWLEEGSIENSVNFPQAYLHRDTSHRLAVINENIPNMVAQISGVLGDQQMNIIDLLNKSREKIAYTLIDVDEPISDTTLQKIRAINGVIRARAW